MVHWHLSSVSELAIYSIGAAILHERSILLTRSNTRARHLGREPPVLSAAEETPFRWPSDALCELYDPWVATSSGAKAEYLKQKCPGTYGLSNSCRRQISFNLHWNDVATRIHWNYKKNQNHALFTLSERRMRKY
jgi:hypothetical protein